MSRLNVNSEPTMEEILASIRRIIAEDPVDPRNGFTSMRASTAVKPALDRALFLRDAAASDALKPAPVSDAPIVTRSPAIEDRPESKFAKPLDPAPQNLAPAVHHSAAAEDDDDDVESDERDAELSATGEPEDEAGDGADAALNEPQLAEPPRPATPTAVTAPRTSAPRDDVEPLDAEFTDITPARGPRAGFTVSRDGYIPPVAEQNGEAATDDVADPFDFDLGPSPFKHERKPLVTDVAMRSNGKATEAPAPATAPKASANEAANTYSYVQYRGTPPAEAPRRRDVLETPAPPATPATPEETKSFAAPRVDATLPPKSDAPSFDAGYRAAPVPPQKPLNETAETIARVSAAASEYVAAAGYVGRQVHQNPVMLEVLDTPGAKVHPVAVRESSPAQQSTELTTEADNLPPSPRTMEDTVADLLRPMLKSWLAEHMPKIVERALRREISELDNPRQKSAAE